MSMIQMYDPKRDYLKHSSELDESILNVVRNGDYINGKCIGELETKLCNFTGSKYSITCANGTDALFISLKSLNIGLNDEVITVGLTWISSAETIALTGAKPVWIDVDKKTFCMNPDLIESAITSNTKAILCVSLYGFMPDYSKIYNIALKYNLYVIEDGAQSFGSVRDNYKSCSNKYTHISTTSFFPTKPLGCFGDGGCIFTNDEQLYIKIKAIKSHGGERFNHTYIGVNSRLDTIQASVLLTKFKWLDEVLVNRRLCAIKYNELLSDIPDIILPQIDLIDFNVFAQYPLLLSNKFNRDEIVSKLKAENINVSVFYPIPLYKQPCFSNCDTIPFLPNTEEICNTILNLPCYGYLSLNESILISNTLKKVLYS